MNVRPEDLGRELRRGIAPLYVIHGDEPLLALEAADEVRAAARAAGVDEREVFVVDPSFRWDAFRAADANLGLFGGRKLVDLRIPGGRPGADGARALEQYASRPNPDNVVLVTLPRVDKATQSSAWFAALAEAGVVVAVQPLEREALPRWIGARLTAQKQKASTDTLAFLADHCEGNLLAARQEIEKLALVLPEGELDAVAVERAVADVARYDVFAASEAWLAGDAPRVARILAVLEADGDGPQLALWALGEDLHAIAAVHAATRSGTPMQAALRNARVWGKRAAALERATRRIDTARLDALLPALFRVDALSKGLGRGSAWDELVALALGVAGATPRPLATIATGVPEEVRR